MKDISESGHVTALKRLALESLTSFDGELCELERLLAKIKAVLSDLEAMSDASWIKESRRQWGQLEILYSLVLESARVILTDEERSDAKEIVLRLEDLFRS